MSMIDNSPHTQRYLETRTSSTKLANQARWDWSKRDPRSKIAGTRIVKRLQAHTLGKIEMTNSAVRAGIALLDRVLPVLQSVELKSETVVRYVLEVPPASLSAADWERLDTNSSPDRVDQPKTIDHSST
jgi:hypothetical protein